MCIIVLPSEKNDDQAHSSVYSSAVRLRCRGRANACARSVVRTHAILVGDWVGEADGGTGSFSFKFDVQDSVLVRRNHAEYPAKGAQPAIIHDDLLVIFKEGSDLQAMYWDNEKHVIRYAVTPSAAGVEFVSETAKNAPSFRLTYRKTANDKLEIVFEIAPPGKPFTPYLKGVAHRVAAK